MSYDNINYSNKLNSSSVLMPGANESYGRQAIEQGINNILNNTIYTDQQIYIRYLDNIQKTSKFDKVVTLNNQTWAFNYITINETLGNMSSLKNIVNIWENSTLTYNEIVTQVQNYINGTKV